MARESATYDRDLISDVEEQGIIAMLNSHFRELMSLGPSPQRNVCRLSRDYLTSTFGLEYFTKLNLLIKVRLAELSQKERDEICRWIDNEVMEGLNRVCETDIFDNPKTLSALGDMLFALLSSLNTIDEEDVLDEVEYLFDIPYRLNEMLKESPTIPRSYRLSVKREEADWSERVVISTSERSVSLSYSKDLKR